jgi:HSP20 family protein
LDKKNIKEIKERKINYAMSLTLLRNLHNADMFDVFPHNEDLVDYFALPRTKSTKTNQISASKDLISGRQQAFARIVEEQDQFKVLLDIPGVAKENVKLMLTPDHVLEITADEKGEEEKEENGQKIKRSHARSYYQSISLPDNVERDNVVAALEHGVLQVTLKKVEKKRPEKRQITIA